MWETFNHFKELMLNGTLVLAVDINDAIVANIFDVLFNGQVME